MRCRLRPIGPLFVLAALMALLGREGSITAQPKGTPITLPPQMPTINAPFPLGVQRGQSIELTLLGTNLTDPTGLMTTFPAKVTFPTDQNNGKDAAKVRVKLEVPGDAPIGFHTVRLATKNGISNARIFCVDDLPQIEEKGDNKSKDKAQVVPLPIVVAGKADAEVSDFFRFTVKPGERLTFEVLGRRLGSAFDPVIKLYNAQNGRELPGHYSDDEPGLQSDSRLTRTFAQGGDYLVEVRDTRYQGGADYFYRLRIANGPNAMTAFPVAQKRGVAGTVSFSGRGVENVPAVPVTVPLDREVVNVVPKGATSGWPVPVYGSDIEEVVEKEPNNDLAHAQRLNVPSGVTGRFLDKSDSDWFTFAAKKGVKYAIVADTYEINSPAEVYLVVKDAKGADLAKSNPQNTPARIDFTPPADGDFTIVAEHLNYLHGPTEVYHLTVQPVAPSFEVSLQTDRFTITPGGTSFIPVAAITRKEYTGPIEFNVVGHPGLTGSLTVPNLPAPPAGSPIALIPLNCKPDVIAGGYEIRVQLKATINGQQVTEYATVSDIVKAGLSGLSYPPREMLSSLGVAVVAEPQYVLSTKWNAPQVVRGLPATLTVSAKRAAGFVDEIQFAPLVVAPNVTIAVKPIPKGGNEVSFPVTIAPAAALGDTSFVLRGSSKPGGKEVVVYTAPIAVKILSPVEVKAEPLTLKPGEKGKLKVAVTRVGDYKGPVDIEVKNLPANVTAVKVTVAPDKNSVEVEVAAGPKAVVGDKGDVQVVATATAAGNQQTTQPNLLVKIVK
jgi:hypothetical protein